MNYCNDFHKGYKCTLRVGHSSSHAAYNYVGDFLTSWPNIPKPVSDEEVLEYLTEGMARRWVNKKNNPGMWDRLGASDKRYWIGEAKSQLEVLMETMKEITNGS